jgi:hypothetical protein
MPEDIDFGEAVRLLGEVRDQSDTNLLNHATMLEIFDALVAVLDEKGIMTRQEIAAKRTYQRKLRESIGLP